MWINYNKNERVIDAYMSHDVLYVKMESSDLYCIGGDIVFKCFALTRNKSWYYRSYSDSRYLFMTIQIEPSFINVNNLYILVEDKYGMSIDEFTCGKINYT